MDNEDKGERLARVYACRGGSCSFVGTLEHTPTGECPLCGGRYMEFVGVCPTDASVPSTLFSSRRTRDREAEVDKKKQRKRPGAFESIKGKLHFKRS